MPLWIVTPSFCVSASLYRREAKPTPPQGAREGVDPEPGPALPPGRHWLDIGTSAAHRAASIPLGSSLPDLCPLHAGHLLSVPISPRGLWDPGQVTAVPHAHGMLRPAALIMSSVVCLAPRGLSRPCTQRASVTQRPLWSPRGHSPGHWPALCRNNDLLAQGTQTPISPQGCG